jgi:hypothetical protein
MGELGLCPNHFVFLCPSKLPSRPGRKSPGRRRGGGLWVERALSSACPRHYSESEDAANYRALEKLGSRDDSYTRQSLSGTRCAVSNSAGKEVQVLDFNPVRGVRILEHLAEKKDPEWEKLRELLVNSQSTIPAGKYFKHDIVSHLPYFHIRREEAKGELLMDDQWVVQARVCLF